MASSATLVSKIGREMVTWPGINSPVAPDMTYLRYLATAPITEGQAVSLSGPWSVAPSGPASTAFVGVAAHNAQPGSHVQVYYGNTQRLTSAAAIEAGATVTTAPGGAVTSGTASPIGVALTAASKAGQAVTVLTSALTSTPAGGSVGLSGATETASPSMIVIGSLGGVPYARPANGASTLHRSLDEGGTWQQVANVLAYGIAATGDGEVIANAGGVLRKSSGWSVNPATATWSVVATANGASSFIQSNLDTYQNIVIAAEYAVPRNDARYVKVSTNNGATFTNVLDLNVLHPGQDAQTHWHAVCIDRWHTGPNPRLWASHGDGPRGVYYSDDLGATWTLYVNDWQPMPMISTPNGIVTSTDQNNPDGVWLIPRGLGARRLLHGIRVPFWNGSLLGFGIAATRDPRDPSRVVILFRGDQNASFTEANPGRMFVSDGHQASEVYATANTATVGVAGFVAWDSPPAITLSGRVLATYSVSSGGRSLVAGQLTSVSPTKQGMDSGNVLTGSSRDRTDIAIGAKSVASGRSVVIGANAGTTFVHGTDARSVAVGEETTIRHESAAVGFQAEAASLSTSLGTSAKSTGTEATTVGSSATSSAQYGIAMGRQANSASYGAIAIGRTASASGNSSAVVGFSASATASETVAFGLNAKALHTRAVALGSNVESTAAWQVAIGPRHLELTELAADPTAPAVNQARLYTRDNGAGKTELCVRFASGVVQVISTEP